LEIAAILSAVDGDWVDFAIITFMLVVNALIGFHEEHKAKQSLDALKSQMTATVPVKRNGTMVIMPVADLVPGDIIFLRGGNVVPADCQWLEGDPMLVDTAALTGEPIPRKVPRPDRSGEEPGAGSQLLSGCIIKQGEGHCEVKYTGLNTEIGQAAGLVQEASGHSMGVFETKIMQVVKAVILITLIDAGVVLYVNVFQRDVPLRKALLGVLALVIGAVPIALPLVMQVTMAIGAAKMASKKAIVTHLTALQEIASMTVLCSDKTGTLTTANMRVMPQMIWTRNGHTRDDALIFSGVASNPANKEDPIDKAVLDSVSEHFGTAHAEDKLSEFRKTKFVGFNPTVKRTTVYCEHPKLGSVKLAKGLIDKVLSTGDDGGDCWECADVDQIRPEVKEADSQFALQGYKTVGVAMALGSKPMEFVGIVPMLDPPREDTMLTIHRIRQGGVAVKMITGDHLNIAIETSRLIGLGTNVLPATSLWPASATRDELVLSADGFAQVLPKDKRECVLILQNKGLVVGMTGDGVNDAPALAQAQVGIAVDGATEAARSASDIILTEPGLSVIFDAVVESRKIFARLRAYVLYRVAATIQIVLVLSILIYAYDDALPALYVILLALLNDVSMLPVANDNACASALPEIPTMPAIMLASCIYGVIETAATMIFYESKWCAGDGSAEYRDAVIYLQISIAIELLIFSCRTPGFVLGAFIGKSMPSMSLAVAVLASNVLVSLLAGFGKALDNQLVHQVDWVDIAWIWAYDVAWLVVIDAFKVFLSWTGTGWMSAGAAGGVLEYAELPVERGWAHQSSRSTLAQSRVSNIQRSALNRSVQASARSIIAGSSHTRSASMLPYPYNLRQAAIRTTGSF
jgi:H+-transporting ATPase